MRQSTLGPDYDKHTSAKDSDVRYTPEHAVMSLIGSDVAPDKSMPIVEPCAGEGHICRVLTREGYSIKLAVELRKECRDSLANWPTCIGDWFWTEAELIIRHCAIVTNPPFSLAPQFWLSCCRRFAYVAMLLRCNIIGSNGWCIIDGMHVMQRYQPTAIRALHKRPSFTGDGKTDSAEYSWFVRDLQYRANEIDFEMV
jgi:hypothetical protein